MTPDEIAESQEREAAERELILEDLFRRLRALFLRPSIVIHRPPPPRFGSPREEARDWARFVDQAVRDAYAAEIFLASPRERRRAFMEWCAHV